MFMPGNANHYSNVMAVWVNDQSYLTITMTIKIMIIGMLHMWCILDSTKLV